MLTLELDRKTSSDALGTSTESSRYIEPVDVADDVVFLLPFPFSRHQPSASLSFTCWLFAQFPQVIENYRNGSVEGLALPFLVSWLAGDFTNLVGCILTNQLPFQIYLATYFCLIDTALMYQYVYYTRQARRRISQIPPSMSASTASLAQHPHLHYNPQRNLRSMSRQRRAKILAQGDMTASFLSERSVSPGTLKRMALSRTESYASNHKKKRRTRTAQSSMRNSFASISAYDGLPSTEEGSDGNELEDDTPDHSDVPSDMLDSFQSDRSRNSATSTVGATERGRKKKRSELTFQSAPLAPLSAHFEDNPSSSAPLPEMRESSTSQVRRPISRHRYSSTSHSKTRNVVFLSICTFLCVGRLSFISPVNVPLAADKSAIAWRADLASLRNASPVPQYASNLINTSLHRRSNDYDDPFPDQPPPMDSRRIVGRVCAWIMVIFYLTSRMPQIWKNFRRRSVEGLSMLLFGAAFAGNFFYVLSILLSPYAMEEEGYLMESLPFLMGSGGTLLFDIMIMLQACMYGKRPSKRRRAKELHLESSGGNENEVAGLLHDQDDGHTITPQSRSRSRHRSSRSRTTSSQSVPQDPKIPRVRQETV